MGDERVLYVDVDLDLASKDAFRESLSQAREGDEPVIVDLTEVAFLDSSGLAVILGAHLDGTEVRLRGVRPTVRRTLEIAGVEDLLPVEP